MKALWDLPKALLLIKSKQHQKIKTPYTMKKLLLLFSILLLFSYTPIHAQARLVFAGDAFMVIKNNAVLVVDNSSTNAIK